MQSTQSTTQSERTQQTEHPTIDRKMVWLLAVATGLAVANLYYGQPLLADIARGFAVSVNSVGIAATATQAGYAVGLLLIVPLGDAFERRRLIVIMLIAVTIALAATALSPSIPWLVFACFAVGVTTIVPQIIVPLAASLAAPRERARVVGMVMSGLLIGVLLARTVSGFIGAQFGWRTMYWIAAGLMLLLALALRFTLPRHGFWRIQRLLVDAGFFPEHASLSLWQRGGRALWARWRWRGTRRVVCWQALGPHRRTHHHGLCDGYRAARIRHLLAARTVALGPDYWRYPARSGDAGQPDL